MADKELGFTTARRLLQAAEFSNVFDNNTIKVSNQSVLILALPNQLAFPRLGLVVGKKNIRLANRRNRAKRLFRESFRQHQHELPAVDIVIMARRSLDSKDNHIIMIELAGLWQKLNTRSKQ